MNPPKVDEYEYIQFLLAAQHVFSIVEASKIVSGEDAAPAHDANTRLLRRNPPDRQALWQAVEHLVVLVIDDTTLDKPYAEKMAMVSRHWCWASISFRYCGRTEQLICRATFASTILTRRV
jgi:hypothetical protein